MSAHHYIPSPPPLVAAHRALRQATVRLAVLRRQEAPPREIEHAQRQRLDALNQHRAAKMSRPRRLA